VWFARLEEIAAHLLKCEAQGTYRPRVDAVPFYDSPVGLVPIGPDKPKQSL
jgi:hypothetical protein